VVTARDENHLAPVAPLLEVGAWIVPAASDEVAELESMDQGRSDQTCIAIMGY
jgi:hypothetical protein